MFAGRIFYSFFGAKNEQTDIGAHYVMAGHNARINATYSKLKDPLASTVERDQFIVGLQLNY